jgi:hypothetical protein
MKQGSSLHSSPAHASPAESGRPAASGRGRRCQGASPGGEGSNLGHRQWRGSPWGGLTAVKQVGGGEEMAASRSRGHWRDPSGGGGSTRRRGAWGGVEMVGGGLEQAVHGGSVRSERNDNGGSEEQLRAPARRSWELPTLVRSSGQ